MNLKSWERYVNENQNHRFQSIFYPASMVPYFNQDLFRNRKLWLDDADCKQSWAGLVSVRFEHPG
jgi:hypothetical protein